MLSEKAHRLTQVHDWEWGWGESRGGGRGRKGGWCPVTRKPWEKKNPQTQHHEFYSTSELLLLYSAMHIRPLSVSLTMQRPTSSLVSRLILVNIPG